MKYELYTAHPWYGTKSRYYETLDEVIDVLRKEGYAFKWQYEQGREVLHENCYGTLAQVFEDGVEITRKLNIPHRNLNVLY